MEQKLSVVREAFSSRQIYDQHCHTDFEILFVLSGSVRLNLEGKQLILSENSGIVIPPLKYHTVAGNNTRYHRLILTFPQEAIPDGIRSRFLTAASRTLQLSGKAVSGLLCRMGEIADKKDPAFAPLEQAILTEILYAVAFEDAQENQGAADKNMERLKRITALVEENLHRELSLGEVAGKMYMSESALCHFFKGEMDIPLKQYILRKKMAYAQSLLKKGETPGAVAELCGYRNYPSFYKIYRKITGSAPARAGQKEAEP